MGAYEGLGLGKESQDLGHQPLSLFCCENELRMGRAFEDHQLFRVGGFLILLTNSGESQSIRVCVVAAYDEQFAPLDPLGRAVRRGGQQHQPINLARFGLDRRVGGASSKVDNSLY